MIDTGLSAGAGEAGGRGSLAGSADFRVFERVVATGSLSAAARQLGLTPAAISKRLALIESRLGVRLVTRTTRECRPTAEGEIFARRCRDILDRIEAAEQEIRPRPDQPIGLLRVSAPISFGRRKIAPLLTAFRERHPAVSVSLTLSSGSNDLADGEYDVALRVGMPKNGRFVIRRVLSARRAVCASPAYIERRGRPERPADLASHDCILLTRDGQPLDRWMFEVGGNAETVKVSGPLLSNSGEIIQQWTLDGLGISLKSMWDVEEDLREGRLVEVLAGYSCEQADIYAVFPDRKNLPSRVRAFLDFLAAEMTEVRGGGDL